MGALLIVTGRDRLSPTQVLALVLLLSALPWLGAKYAPLSALVALYVLWRAEPKGRAVLVAGGTLSALGYAAFHLATYESLTPYNVNLVYAGGSTASIVGEHVEIGDRVYRLWGLLIDRRFGVARWAPVLLAIVPGLVLLARGDARLRLVLGLVAAQVLIATFVVITMMGWWFPGRTLVTVFPLLPIPLVLVASRGGRVWRTALVALGVYSLAVTAALAQAGRSREVVIAVDPFEMQAGFFRGVAGLFPQYTSWTSETWLLTVAWLGLGGIALAAWAAWALSGLAPARGTPRPAATVRSVRAIRSPFEQSQLLQRLAIDVRDTQRHVRASPAFVRHQPGVLHAVAGAHAPDLHAPPGHRPATPAIAAGSVAAAPAARIRCRTFASCTASRIASGVPRSRALALTAAMSLGRHWPP